jgi:methyltransferase (TIGR00027 family)
MALVRVKPIAVTLLTLWIAGSSALALEPGLPSKTAVFAAAARAVGSKNPDPTERNPDYLAIKFLGRRERAILPEFPLDALDLGYTEAMAKLGSLLPVPTHTFRTKAFDSALRDALRHGVRQVVVLGAGFDSRAYRFQSRLHRIRFIEVDSGPTQEYKKQRVKEILGSIPANVTYVPVDFTKDDLLTELVKGGYSEQQKTFFLWEGVTVYLPETAVKDTLHFVRDHAAPGSLLAFDYFLRKDPNVNNPDLLFAGWGEPWLFGFPDEGAADYVKREALEVVSDQQTTQMALCIARVPAHR